MMLWVKWLLGAKRDGAGETVDGTDRAHLAHWLLDLPKKTQKMRLVGRRAAVSFDDDSISCKRSDGSAETIKWSDLRAVLIQTTGDGPFVDDLFLLLIGRETGCVVPSKAEGVSLLLERLQKLPGFKNEVVIQAMGSTDNREFLCWIKSDDPTGGHLSQTS